jgi:hypothetical protein
MITGLVLSGGEGGFSSQWFGYLIMIVALSLIFVGIKRYRDLECGGVIRFGQALLLGMGIAAVAGVAYVLVWEIYLASTDYTFIETYTTSLIEAKKAEGLAGVALQEEIVKMEEMREMYENPLFRLPITFTEIFPVGFLIALISAAILRNPRVMPAQT